jgi:hypothetical protein
MWWEYGDFAARCKNPLAERRKNAYPLGYNKILPGKSAGNE